MNKTIIGIKFKEAGKIYFFDPKGEKLKKGDYVIVVSNDGKWAKVRTDKGKVGYIKSKKIANEVPLTICASTISGNASTLLFAIFS